MSTKTPIESADIRKGDIVRFEYDHPPKIDNARTAVEFRAQVDQVPWTYDSGRHYLLSRPTVQLPSGPTFGVLEWTAGPNTETPGEVRRVFAEWYQSPCISTYRASDTPTQVHATGLGLQVSITAVSKFTASTIVPTSALDELRGGVGHWSHLDPTSIVGKFLAAVDDAT